MKKKLFLSAAVLLTACLIGSNNRIELTSPIEESPVEQEVSQEKRGLILPEVPGVSIIANTEDPQVGDIVKLEITPNTSKRVDLVTLNGKVLNGQKTSSTIICEFVMPLEGAEIKVEAVDVYTISVDESVSSSLAITGIEGNVAAEGETVRFRPATYAGFWYSGIRAVDEDVVVTPVENQAEWYEFIMPNHNVTLTSETGKNIYQVMTSNNKITVGESEVEIWNMSVLTPNSFHEFGEALQFKVYESTSQYKVTEIKLDGREMTPNPDNLNFYEFLMPAYDVMIDVCYDIWYRNISVNDGSDAFDATLKKVVDGVEVEITDGKIVAGEEVRIYVSEVGDVSKLVPSISLKTGSSLDSMSNSSTTVTFNEEGGYYSFTAPAYEFISVELAQNESFLKGEAVVGDYHTGMKFKAAGNFVANVGNDTTFAYNVYSTEPDAVNGYRYTYPLSIVEEEDNHYVVNNSSSMDLFTNGEDLVLFRSYSDFYFYTKGSSGIVASTSDETHTFAYYLGSTYTATEVFMQMEYGENGETVSVYYNNTTKVAHFGATATLLKGVNGRTTNDIIGIKDAEGNTIKTLKVTTPGVVSNSFSHQVEEVILDGYEGTYTHASDETAQDLVITGFGDIKIGDVTYSYTVDGGLIRVEIDGETVFFAVDKETHTYVVSTDGLEGTYTSSTSQTLVVDGYGACTLDGLEGTYVKTNTNVISVTIGENTTSYLLNKDELTFAEIFYEIDNSSTYTFVEDESGNLVSNNAGVNSSSAVYKITALKKTRVSFTYTVSSEANWDKFFVYVNSDAVVNAKSGSVTETFETTLNAGDVLELRFTKDGSGQNGTDNVTISDLLIEDEVVLQDGLEGTYLGDIGEIVLDGFGNATHNGTTYTYGNDLIIVIEGTPYQLNSETKTYAEAAPYTIDTTSESYTFVANENGELVTNNYNISRSTASYKIIANIEITVSFTYIVSSEANCDKFFVYVNGTAVVNAESGEVTDTFETTLNAGDVLELKYTKDGSVNKGTDNVTISQLRINGELLLESSGSTEPDPVEPVEVSGTFEGTLMSTSITLVLDGSNGTYNGTAFTYTVDANGVFTITGALEGYELTYNASDDTIEVVYDYDYSTTLVRVA